jgi:putative CocE/NonD family hydrolase
MITNNGRLRVLETETIWIPMSDGSRLAAKLWLPEDAAQNPVPAIIEYLPYRRRDGTAVRDAVNHSYLAGHGYACLRIDIRGSGDSDGFFDDEYSPQEQADCVEAIAWIAAQPWCSGRVGMWGISWGGFKSLQVAAHRPPALKAIITVCSTDDRYADDTHYMGGCLLLGNLNWGANMFAIATKPPDPEVVGEGWREIWLKRLEKIPHLVSIWTKHQRRDAYWRQGSVCENYSAIECAVFAVGGWADSYTNAIPRLLAGLKSPKLGLIGPWGHAYAHEARPGPAIGFLQESLRWWDQWLKGRDTGIMREPLMRAWMQEAVPPATWYKEIPGRWVAETGWPSPDIKLRSLFLGGDGGLGESAPTGAQIPIASPQTIGMGSGAWCPYGMPGDLPTDQRIDDGQAVVFETEPFAERMELLGAPMLAADVSADRPNALLVARLSLLSPHGAATRISYGVLNLTHRDSHAEPSPLVPGQRCRVIIKLNDVGQAIPAGYRLRLALSNAYWPTIWPSPQKTIVTLHTGGSRLDLPVRPLRADDKRLRPFDPPEGSAPLRTVVMRPPSRERTAKVDLTGERLTVVAFKDRGAERIVQSGIETDNEGVETYAISADDPLSARAEMRWRNGLARGGWRIRTETTTVQTATECAFLITTSLDAYENDARIYSRSWTFEIPRDHV